MKCSLCDDMLLLVGMAHFTLIISGCGDRTEVTPSELLPFEYQANLTLVSSNCLESDKLLRRNEMTGSIEIGERDDIVTLSLNTPEMSLTFSGLICLSNDNESSSPQPQAICIGLQSTEVLMSLPRHSMYRTSPTERLLCEKWISSPDSVPSHNTTDRDQTSSSDEEWRRHFERCCERGEQNDYTQRLSLDDVKVIKGPISIKYELDVRLQNTNSSTLSDTEKLGAMSLCGPPHNSVSLVELPSCTERFTLHAEAR